MIETHTGWLTATEHNRVTGVKDATIDRQQKRIAELTFARDRALLQVEVGRRLISSLTGERDRARDTAVRFEQELAHADEITPLPGTPASGSSHPHRRT